MIHDHNFILNCCRHQSLVNTLQFYEVKCSHHKTSFPSTSQSKANSVPIVSSTL
ncbi:hypothetical protein BDR07DRAFT_1398299, partial [Suillus spraguei]